MNFEKLTRYLDSLQEKYNISAVDLNITLGYDTVYRHSAGYADHQRTRPVTDTDLYNIYSASKVITVTAAMQLVEQGKIHLNDRLDQYMPEFSEMVYAKDFPVGQFPIRWPAAGDKLNKAMNPIRILDLFRMTAGMSYDTESAAIQEFVQQPSRDDTMDRAMAALAKMPLLYEPGTRWVYSLSHDVLGGLVERVSGERFSEYLQNHIFKPLGIEDMYFTLTKEQQPRLSAQYAADFDTHEIRPVPQGNRYRFTDTYESGGAGLICTVDAYARFVEALANGGIGRTGKRILTMKSINELRRNRLDDRMLVDFASTGKTGYGYGLGVRTLMNADASKSPVGEFGWDGAAGAFALIDTENKLGIFFAEHVLGLIENYHVIHPMIRDLAYEAVLG